MMTEPRRSFRRQWYINRQGRKMIELGGNLLRDVYAFVTRSPSFTTGSSRQVLAMRRRSRKLGGYIVFRLGEQSPLRRSRRVDGRNIVGVGAHLESLHF